VGQVPERGGEALASGGGVGERITALRALAGMPAGHFQNGLQLGVFGDADTACYAQAPTVGRQDAPQFIGIGQ
jgi:hypothetical protein